MLQPLVAAGSKQGLICTGFAYKTLGVNSPGGGNYIMWFERAYNSGSTEAGLYLGIFHYKAGRYKEAENILKKGADEGDMSSMFWLALSYIQDGERYSQASELLEKASRMGHIHAQARLGRILIRRKVKGGSRVRGLSLFVHALVKAVTVVRKDSHSPYLR